MTIQGKVIFISGSTRGIGRELALQCARRGGRVIIHGRQAVRVQAVKRQLATISSHVDGVSGDLVSDTERARIIRFLKMRYGKIDIFVNNAAVSMRGTFANCTPNLLHNMITTNVTATVLLVHAMIHLLNERGTLLFVSSAAGLYGFPQIIPYSITKMCLSALHHGLDIELHERKIHVGTVYLDFVENDPEKTIFNEHNKPVKVVRHARLTQTNAARAILLAIEHRHRTRYIGAGTKLVAILARYFPHLFHRLLIIKKHAIHQAAS